MCEPEILLFAEDNQGEPRMLKLALNDDCELQHAFTWGNPQAVTTDSGAVAGNVARLTRGRDKTHFKWGAWVEVACGRKDDPASECRAKYASE